MGQSAYSTDDSLLFLDKDETHARNLKFILTCFEMISRNKDELS
jgi:hypothetical protein